MMMMMMLTKQLHWPVKPPRRQVYIRPFYGDLLLHGGERLETQDDKVDCSQISLAVTQKISTKSLLKVCNLQYRGIWFILGIHIKRAPMCIKVRFIPSLFAHLKKNFHLRNTNQQLPTIAWQYRLTVLRYKKETDEVPMKAEHWRRSNGR